jgi:bleomycin hydrolase
MKKPTCFMTLLLAIAIFANTTIVYAKDAKEKNKEKEEGYKFTSKIEIPCTPVKDQASTGTCWSFATTSFIESEIMRLGKGVYDLSEMFFVHYAYSQKAAKYIRYQGMANFGEGGQAHDVMNLIHQYGLIPEEAYSGINYGLTYHRHGEMEAVMRGILDKSLENKNVFSGKSIEVVDAALDIYLGKIPESFTYQKTTFTPMTFASIVGFNPADYIEFTSYQSYPFNTWVDLEIPDNWSHGTYFNIPVDEIVQIMNYAFEKGYSVNWDGDVSEPGFSHKKGVAIIPESDPKNMEESERLKWEAMSEEEKSDLLFDFSKPRIEKTITQEMRQKTFNKFQTTDDHLMHLVGTAADQKGTNYFRTKNSWADDSNDLGGYLYMSETYIRLKTIAIQVHKDAIPETIKQKMGLK